MHVGKPSLLLCKFYVNADGAILAIIVAMCARLGQLYSWLTHLYCQSAAESFVSVGLRIRTHTGIYGQSTFLSGACGAINF